MSLVLLALAPLTHRVPLPTPPPVADAALFGLVGLALALASAPWAWMRDVALERRFDRPAQSRPWAWRFGWQWALALVALLGPWLVFQQLQRTVPAAAVPGALGLVVAGSLLLFGLAPWLVTWSPRVRPLADEALAGRLHALIGRAGVRVAGVHAWREGPQMADPNAALLGAGPGRRLLLSDGLLAQFSPEEIDIVVAHELGHHAHGHLWRRLRLSWAVAGGVLLAMQAAAWLHAGLSATALADPRGLPWSLLAAGGVIVCTRPRLLMMSRAHEIEADAFALRVTDRPDVLERVLARLGAHYRAAPEPSALEAAFFLTHPPVRERVARARAWRANA